MSDKSMSASPLWLRALQFPLTRLVLLGGAVLLLMAVNNGFLEKFNDSPAISVAITIGMATLAVVLYSGFTRFVEQRPVFDLSLPGMGRELGMGLLIGASLYTVSVLVLMALGMYRIVGLNPWTFVIPAVAMALSSGLFEELIFRGILFRSVEDLCGSWISLIVSAAVFGLIHLHNPAATVLGAISISIEAGVLLAAAYMLTRRLWLSIGFHMSWNYVQSAIFSGAVSGNAAKPGLIRSNIKGPDILTGGVFGLESSAVAFVVCTATGIVLLVMAVRRGKIVPPIWKRAH